MDEQKYEMHFQLIALAGQSKSNSVEAIREAREGNYEEAETLLKEAEEQFAEAHILHFNMLQNEEKKISICNPSALLHFGIIAEVSSYKTVISDLV